MKKYELEVLEELKYTRYITVAVPDDWDDEQVQEAMEFADRKADNIEDYAYELGKLGLDVLEYDRDLDSPDYESIEGWGLELVEEDPHE